MQHDVHDRGTFWNVQDLGRGLGRRPPLPAEERVEVVRGRDQECVEVNIEEHPVRGVYNHIGHVLASGGEELGRDEDVFRLVSDGRLEGG